MTDSKRIYGRKAFYPMETMAVGEVVRWPAPDSITIKRTSRNASQYGIRNGKTFKCRTVEGVTFITRLA